MIIDEPNSFEDRFELLMNQDNVDNMDVGRHAFFYIVAGNSELFDNIHSIYDYVNHSVKTECLDETNTALSLTAKKLIQLGQHMFAGTPANVNEIFGSLDEVNFRLALNAMCIRFGQIGQIRYD